MDTFIQAIEHYLDPVIIGILGVMSFITVWVAIERLLFYRGINLNDFHHAEELNIALTNNLTWISTVGANAPYVGLLGTVLGILLTFNEIGAQNGVVDTANIMVGLAMALKATALGLVVAIPAVMFYNGLLRKVDVINARWRAQQG